MRELIVAAFVSIDGVMQSPGGPDEDPTGGFAQGGWAVNYWDDAMNAEILAMFGQPFELLLGRKTYEIFAAHWPHSDERDERGGTASGVDDPIAARLNAAKKYVASRTLAKVAWNNSTLLKGNAADAVAALKAQDGPPLLTQGSTDLIQSLFAHDLVDELRIWTFPVIVGDGKRLFGAGTVPGGLALAASQTSSTGVVMSTYRPAGAIDLGSFEFDTPTDEELARRARMASN
jgi:dihydrofolate reductase